MSSSSSASAWQPIISDIGNGQGCEYEIAHAAAVTPASSSVSRRTASSIASPGSTKPARQDHMVAAKRAGAAEQAAVAAHRQHDDDRVGAREMLDLAGRAGPLPAAFDEVGRRAAIGAEPVPRVPVQHRLGFGERRQMLGRHQPLHGDRAQIDDVQVVARLERLGVCLLDAQAEAGGAIDQAEEHGFGGRRERARFPSVKAGSKPLRLLEHDQLAADQIARRCAARWRSAASQAPSRRRSAARSIGLCV